MNAKIREYMLDYVTWCNSENNRWRNFGDVFQEYQKRRSELSEHGYVNYGFTLDNPVMCSSSPSARRYIKALRLLDGNPIEAQLNQTIENVSVHGRDNLFVYEYIIVTEENISRKLYVCPFGRDSFLAPEGFLLSEDEFLDQKNLKQLECEKNADSYSYYLSSKKVDDPKEHRQVYLNRCFYCWSVMPPKSKYCHFCGKKNVFFDPSKYIENSDWSLSDEEMQIAFDMNRTCPSCGNKTLCFYNRNPEQYGASRPYTNFCMHCGQKLEPSYSKAIIEKRNRNILLVRCQGTFLGRNGLTGAMSSIAISANGEVIIDDIDLGIKLNDNQLRALKQIVFNYQEILDEIQFESSKTRSGEGYFYQVGIGQYTIGGRSIDKEDMMNIPEDYTMKAFSSCITNCILCEAFALVNSFDLGIVLSFREKPYGFDPAVRISTNTEIDAKIKEEKNRRVESTDNSNHNENMNTKNISNAKVKNRGLFSWLSKRKR